MSINCIITNPETGIQGCSGDAILCTVVLKPNNVNSVLLSPTSTDKIVVTHQLAFQWR